MTGGICIYLCKNDIAEAYAGIIIEKETIR